MATSTTTSEDSPGGPLDQVAHVHGRRQPHGDKAGNGPEDRNQERSISLYRFCILTVTNAAKVVDLSNQQVGTTGIILLRNAIAISSIGLFEGSRLRRLVLSNIGLTDSALVLFAETMARWSYKHAFENRHILKEAVGVRIEAMDLSHNKISTQGANKLLDMIFLMPSLLDLQLHGNPCVENVASPDGVIAMIESTLATKRSQALADGRRTTSQSGVMPPQELPRTEIRNAQPFIVMEKLDLPGMNLGDDGVDHLLIALRRSERDIRIKALVLTGNSITSTGGRNIANFLVEMRGTGSNHAFEVLQLDYNFLGPQGVMHLARAVAGGARVSYLFVARNDCGDEGAIALANAIRNQAEQAGGGHVFPLTSLSVLGNNITTEGARALSNVYLRVASESDGSPIARSWLSTLHMGDNVRVGDGGALEFARAIREFLSLPALEQRRVTAQTDYWGRSNGSADSASASYLSLWRCGVTNVGAWALVEAAKPAFVSVTNEVGGGRTHTMDQGIAFVSEVPGGLDDPYHNILTERLVELDLEWNEDVTSDEIRGRLQEMERHVSRIQQFRQVVQERQRRGEQEVEADMRHRISF